MNKTELISVVAKRSSMTKKATAKAVDAAFAVISEALKNGEKVQLSGFGSFEVKHRKARTGVNPRTKERIVIAASKTPVFTAGKAMKDRMQNVTQA